MLPPDFPVGALIILDWYEYRNDIDKSCVIRYTGFV